VALGARKVQGMRAALRRPMLLLGAGSALGLMAGVFAGRLLGHPVDGADPGDPVLVRWRRRCGRPGASLGRRPGRGRSGWMLPGFA